MITSTSKTNSKIDSLDEIEIDEKVIYSLENRLKLKLKISDQNCDLLQCSICELELSKFAYDASRSGTESQLYHVLYVARIHFDKVRLEKISSLESVINTFHNFAESTYFFGLAGVRSNTLFTLLMKYVNECINHIASRSDLHSNVTSTLQIFVNGITLMCVGGIRLDIGTKYKDFKDSFKRLYTKLETVVREVRARRQAKDCNRVGTTMETEWKSDEDCMLNLKYLRSYYEDITNKSQNSIKSCWLHSCNGLPLHKLWMHSSRQKKVRSSVVVSPSQQSESKNNMHTSNRQYSVEKARTPGIREARFKVCKSGQLLWRGDSPVRFADTSRPLVVDVGCGFGVTLLGWASQAAQSNEYMNFLGCDLSQHCVDYARGLSSRWGISESCRFCVAPADSFLQWVLEHYPGPVAWVLVQFPTPYKLDMSSDLPAIVQDRGAKLASTKLDNVQLPTLSPSSSDNHFMVSRQVTTLAVRIAMNHGGNILLQSNVEDVAVTMKHLFEDAIQTSASSGNGNNGSKTHTSFLSDHLNQNEVLEVSEFEKTSEQIPARQLLWASLSNERACGQGWLKRSPVPRSARTETEAMYEDVLRKPIHRIGWNFCTTICS